MRTRWLDDRRGSLTSAIAALLATSGVEGESDIPYAALVTLLAPAIGLLDRQRGALEWALAIGPPAPGDPLTNGTALLGLLDAISEDQPVMVIVDDAQWLDGASAAALLFAARRLGQERIALALAGCPFPALSHGWLELHRDARGEVIGPRDARNDGRGDQAREDGKARDGGTEHPTSMGPIGPWRTGKSLFLGTTPPRCRVSCAA